MTSTSTTVPMFNEKREFTACRGLDGVTYKQDGCIFNAAKVFVKRIPHYRPALKAPEAKKTPFPAAKSRSVNTPAKAKAKAKAEKTPELSAKQKLGAMALSDNAAHEAAKKENAAAVVAEQKHAE